MMDRDEFLWGPSVHDPYFRGAGADIVSDDGLARVTLSPSDDDWVTTIEIACGAFRHTFTLDEPMRRAEMHRLVREALLRDGE